MCHSRTIFLSLLLVCFFIKGNTLFAVNWTQTSFFLMLNLRVVSQGAFLKSSFKSCFMLLSSCRPPFLQHLLLFPTLKFSVFVAAKEITHSEKGPCQLTCPSFIKVSLRSLYPTGESAAATCIYLRVRLHHDSWGWLRGHLWSSEKWTAALLLACCQTSCLSACLPAPSDLAQHGWNSNESTIWALSLEYAPKCH